MYTLKIFFLRITGAPHPLNQKLFHQWQKEHMPEPQCHSGTLLTVVQIIVPFPGPGATTQSILKSNLQALTKMPQKLASSAHIFSTFPQKPSLGNWAPGVRGCWG